MIRGTSFTYNVLWRLGEVGDFDIHDLLMTLITIMIINFWRAWSRANCWPYRRLKSRACSRTPQVSPCGLLCEPKGLAAGNEASHARRSAGTLDLQTRITRGNTTCFQESRVLVVRITAFSFRKTTARLSTTRRSTSLASAWRELTSSAARSPER